MNLQEWLEPVVYWGRSFDWLLNLIAITSYFVTLFLLVQGYLRYRRLIRMRELKPAQGAIGVAIGVGMNVSEDAKHYLTTHFGSNDEDGQLRVPLVMEYHKDGYFDREKLLVITREVRDKIRELMVIGGVSEVHLFYGGPLAVAAAIGAIVDNWVPVKWYSHNKRTGEYEYMFTLDVEMVKGID